jgi:hypothetical protein
MRIPAPIGYALSTAAIVTMLAGCAGTGNPDGSSAFAPSAQTSGTARTASFDGASLHPLAKMPVCPIVNGDVPLATVASFAVLGGSTVTSTGLTVLHGNLGVSPGTSITGFGPGKVDGMMYAGGPVAAQAQADLDTAYNYAAGRQNPTALPADIGGTTITPGLYNALTTLGITGTATLDGQNKKNSVFIFQIPDTLTAAVLSRVKLINKANACNVFWQVGTSATLNEGSKFEGTIMSAVSISVSSGVKVRGRLLAESGAVTLIDDRINSMYLK